MIQNISSKDKVVGCILGGAVGDALGMPAEFLPRNVLDVDIVHGEPPQLLKLTHPLADLPCGSYTDDTLLTLAQMEYFIKHSPTGNEPIAVLRKALGHWHAECVKSRKTLQRHLGLADADLDRYANRYAGSTTAGAAADYYQDPKRQSGASRSSSCGPLTRLAPLLIYRGFSDIPGSVGDLYSTITHDTPDARVSTGLLASLYGFMFHNTSFSVDQITGRVRETVADIAAAATEDAGRQESCRRLKVEYERLLNLLQMGNMSHILAFGGTSHSFDVLLTALGVLLISKGEFDDTARMVKWVGGDADSIGGIACSLSGILKGQQAIAENFRQFLDHELQPGATEIVEKAERFYEAAKEKGTGVPVKSFRPDRDLVTKTVRHIYADLKARKDSFVPIGDVVRVGKASLLKVLRRSDRRPDILVSKRGILWISPKAICSHPICLASFLEHPQSLSGGVAAARKVNRLIDELEKCYNDTRDENEKWRLANLLECAGTERAAKFILRKRSFRAKAVVMQRNVIADQLWRITSNLRDPAKVAERLYKDTAFLVVPRSLAEFMKAAKVFRPDSLRKQANTIEEIEGQAHLGGIFIISFNGKVMGPVRFEGDYVADASRLPNDSFPVPVGSLALSRVCNDPEAFCIFIFPRRNCVCTTSGGKVLSFSRKPSDPVSFRDLDLQQSREKVQERWQKALSLSRVGHIGLYQAASLVIDAVLESNHGCSACVMNDGNRFVGKSEDKWPPKSLRFGDMKGWEHLNLARTYLQQDGAIVFDAEKQAIVAYGQQYSQTSRPGNVWARIPKEVNDWIKAENRGKRHSFAAMYAAQLRGRAAILVGSERGDVTLFTDRGMVSLLPGA